MKYLMSAAAMIGALTLSFSVFAQGNMSDQQAGQESQAGQSQQAGQMGQQSQAQKSQKGHMHELNKGVSQGGMTAQVSSSQVKEAQKALKNQGYNPGRADGILGQNTRSALRNFQRDNNIQASGTLNQQTLTALGISGQATQSAGQSEQSMNQQPSGQQGGISEGQSVGSSSSSQKGANEQGMGQQGGSQQGAGQQGESNSQ